MLTFIEQVPDDAWRRAARFARSCFDAEGDKRQLFLAEKPLEVFGAPSVDPRDFHPMALVPRGLRFAVLDARGVVAFVSVDCSRRKPVAVSMEFVDEGSKALSALEVADVSARREGARLVRVIQIPLVEARFLWVTGEDPEFVDEMGLSKFDEQAFVHELRARWLRKKENKRGHEDRLKW